MTALNLWLQAGLVGLGGTVTLDLWAWALQRGGVAGVNWPLVGRWIGTMPTGRFAHLNVAEANPVPGEAIIGWSAHYLIGIIYGLPLLLIWGEVWFQHPTLLPPLIVSWLLLVAPYFIMMPCMGSGIAGSRTGNPTLTRFKSLFGHTIFGIGMFATAWAISRL